MHPQINTKLKPTAAMCTIQHTYYRGCGDTEVNRMRACCFWDYTNQYCASGEAEEIVHDTQNRMCNYCGR
jgi:hypothetical protein